MSKKILRLLLLCTVSFGLQAQDKLQEDLSLMYRVRLPLDKSANPPAIILLHGYGSNEADLFALKDFLPPAYLIISARAPLSLSDNAWQWFRMESKNGTREAQQADVTESSRLLKAFIGEVSQKYKTDAVTVIGFSQGAMMAYEIGLTAPGLVQGIVPLSGRVFPWLKSGTKTSAKLQQLRVFIGHGDADDRVPYAEAVSADALLRTLKMAPVFKTYRGLQHSISPTELKDLNSWLAIPLQK